MQRWWLVGIAALLLAGSQAWADDDPRPRRLEIELEFSSKGITLKFGMHAQKPEATPSLDAILPAFVEHWLQHTGDALMRPNRAMAQWLGPMAPLQRWWTGGVRDFGEESDADDPESVFEDMRSRTVPLGLVEVSY
jgi:hypothetical protein